MIEVKYYFLFVLALIWIVFATIQDLRKREVSNWLNFSLLAFAIAYRVFYAAVYDDWRFLGFGILGVVLFMILGNLFYYSKVFAGGDAKLLIALGGVLPFESFWGLLIISVSFVLLLFSSGAVYSLVYSGVIVRRNSDKFRDNFARVCKNNRYSIFASLVCAIFLFILSFFTIYRFSLIYLALLVFVLPWLYAYTKALDGCMIKKISPSQLTEGDWTTGDIRIGNYVIKKTVHGLSLEDIMRLRRAGKKVEIKEGVPFVPAFLIAFVIMLFFLATLSVENLTTFLSLF